MAARQEGAVLRGQLLQRLSELYAIRGQYRDVKEWGESVGERPSWSPRPGAGSYQADDGPGGDPGETEGLSAAILSVYEQTIAGINRGMTPDQLVQAVRLPAELARSLT